MCLFLCREKNHSNMIDLLEQACRNLRERAPEHLDTR